MDFDPKSSVDMTADDETIAFIDAMNTKKGPKKIKLDVCKAVDPTLLVRDQMAANCLDVDQRRAIAMRLMAGLKQ